MFGSSGASIEKNIQKNPCQAFTLPSGPCRLPRCRTIRQIDMLQGIQNLIYGSSVDDEGYSNGPWMGLGDRKGDIPCLLGSDYDQADTAIALGFQEG